MRESERKARQRAARRAQGYIEVTVAVPIAHRDWLLSAAKHLRDGFPPPSLASKGSIGDTDTMANQVTKSWPYQACGILTSVDFWLTVAVFATAAFSLVVWLK